MCNYLLAALVQRLAEAERDVLHDVDVSEQRARRAQQHHRAQHRAHRAQLCRPPPRDTHIPAAAACLHRGGGPPPT